MFMKAMVLKHQAPIETSPLIEMEVTKPTPKSDEILVRITACGVCRTDLHVIEGDLLPHKLPLIPGHQIVGIVEEVGTNCCRFKNSDRIGIAWLRETCQHCIFCNDKHENLCESSQYTGYDADGGYAQYAVVKEDYAYKIPDSFDDAEATPLLCAGIIGYHALKESRVPSGGNLGMIGFGSSAHITIQIALHKGCKVYVMSRDEKHRRMAKELGAIWVGSGKEPFPILLDSVIVFAPAGELVPVALKSVRKAGTVALAGISMTNIPEMEYTSCLFHEKNLRSVEANTREDGEELLQLAAEIPIKPRVKKFPLSQANEVLKKLKDDAIEGTAVLIP